VRQLNHQKPGSERILNLGLCGQLSDSDHSVGFSGLGLDLRAALAGIWRNGEGVRGRRWIDPRAHDVPGNRLGLTVRGEVL
jgi:hypothetical protein